jgi:predicted outer membrane repeat protein
MTMIGDGVNSSVLDGDGGEHVVTVPAGVTAVLQGVRLVRASSTGVHIDHGALTLIDSEVSGNQGGGINTWAGTLALTRSLVHVNQGYGITSHLTGASVSLTESTISGNQLGGIWASSTTLMLTDSTIRYNKGSGLSLGSGPATLTNCTVNYNEAARGAGINMSFTQLTLAGTTTVAHNTAANDGGGVYVAGGTLTLRDQSRVTGNSADLDDADSGGGICNAGGTVVFQDSSCVVGNQPNQCTGVTCPACPA